MGFRVRCQVKRHVEETWKPNITLFVSSTETCIILVFYLLLAAARTALK
jgi:hypothetical protein